MAKSYKLGKNFRVNVSKSGLGASVGVPGYRIGVGPRGTRVTAGIPGTGISSHKTYGTSSKKRVTPKSKPISTGPVIRKPGIFAPRHEKDLFKGMQLYLNNDHRSALPYFLSAYPKEPLGGIVATLILANDNNTIFQAISILEEIFTSDRVFPTPLSQKYLPGLQVKISITPTASVLLPIDALTIVLFLVELYQRVNRREEAIQLLEELIDLNPYPAVKLSLCELYAEKASWNQVIEIAKSTEVEDDITLNIAIFYGRALQQNNLHDAAVKVFSESIRKKKDRNPALIIDGQYWRALSYEALGKKAQAKKAFQEIFASDPDFRDIRSKIKIS